MLPLGATSCTYSPHSILYQITLITNFQQMPYYFQPLRRFLFITRAELQEIGPEMCFSTSNPLQWRCRSACFCTFPLMEAEAYWVVFRELWPLSSLSWVLCAAHIQKGGKNGGAQQWEGNHTSLYTLCTLHIPFSVPHLTLKACVM